MVLRFGRVHGAAGMPSFAGTMLLAYALTASATPAARSSHDRIRSRLGRVVSHPRSVEVHVENGTVHLGGHIFTRELDNLQAEVKHVAGVRAVRSELICHDNAVGISELQGRTTPPGRETRAFH